MTRHGTRGAGTARFRMPKLARVPLLAAFGVAIACGGCGAVTAANASTATPTLAPATPTQSTPTAAPPPAHALIGAFHFSGSEFKMDSDAPSELVMVKTVILAGKSSGWHTHPGPAFVIVLTGTVSRYVVGDNGTCTSATYTAGQGFVEAPGVVHIARNEGTTDVTLQATFLDVAPGSVAFKAPAAAPAGCPGIS
jgi:quercetin dioxygenase-like cupin family protein